MSDASKRLPLQRLNRLAAAAGIAAVCLGGLAACGGGSSGSDDGLTAQQREDRAASGSVAGLMAWASAQIAGGSDAAEPRSVDAITPPASDSDEALAL